MKIESTLMSKFTPARLFRKRGVTSHTLVNPEREWGVMLVVTTVVGLLLFSYSGIEFYRQYTDSDRPEVSEEHIPKYRAQDAELLIRYHEGRRKSFDALREDKPYIPPLVSEETEAGAEGGGVVAGDETGG